MGGPAKGRLYAPPGAAQRQGLKHLGAPIAYRPAPMLVRRFGGALRVLVVVVAAASAAAAGFLASPVRARNPVCADAGVTSPDAVTGRSDGCADGDLSLPATTTTAPATELPGDATTVTEDATTVTEEPEIEPVAPLVTTAGVVRPEPPPAPAGSSSRTVGRAAVVRAPRSDAGAQAAPATAAAPPSVAPAVRPQSATPALSGGPYVFPVVGRSSFADTWGAARADVGWHHGVDIFARLGAPVVAVADGTLLSVGWNRIGGRRAWLRDRDGNYFYFAHLSGFAEIATDGAQVSAGTVIGFVGNTGDAQGTPYHLHFEIHPKSLLQLGYDGAVDPFGYLSTWQREAVSHQHDAAAGTAPRAGAILLGFTDIASASGAPSSLHIALDAQPSTALPVSYRAREPARTSLARPRSRRRRPRTSVSSARSMQPPDDPDQPQRAPGRRSPAASRAATGSRYRQRLPRGPAVPTPNLGVPRRNAVRGIARARDTRAADRDRRARPHDTGMARMARLQRSPRPRRALMQASSSVAGRHRPRCRWQVPTRALESRPAGGRRRRPGAQF